jgi:phage terminase small subunit
VKQKPKPPSRKGKTKASQGAPADAKKSAEALAGASLPAETGPDLDVTKLPIRHQVFIEEYLTDLNGTQAAIRAGYAASDAASRASKLLDRPEIKAIVQAAVDDRIERIRMTRERVLDAYADIAEADANELSEHRRVCCRHCHGAYDPKTGARARQMTPAEYVRKRDAHEERRAEIKATKSHDIGDFKEEAGDWYDKRLPINPECNECFGDGIGEVVLKDTRLVSRRARSAYQGVEEGKDGIKIKAVGRGEALTVLAKHHKIFDESPTVAVTFDATTLDATFGEAMRKSAERMEQMRKDRAAAREKRGD